MLVKWYCTTYFWQKHEGYTVDFLKSKRIDFQQILLNNWVSTRNKFEHGSMSQSLNKNELKMCHRPKYITA